MVAARLASRAPRAPFARGSPAHAGCPGLTTDFVLTMNFPINFTLVSALVWMIYFAVVLLVKDTGI